MGKRLNQKIKLAVLAGGPSSEHEVSLKTGDMVFKNLDKKIFKARLIKIGKDGQWPITIEKLKKKIDIAFIALHGEYGEDGTVQSLLETFDIPYTGSDPIASALAMNKPRTNFFLAKNGFRIPESILIRKKDPDINWAAFKKLKLPVVVKPADRGSSVGTSIVKNLSQFGEAVNHAIKYSDTIMVERYIKGREITCGVLEVNNVTIPLLPTEIIPKKGKFFDFESKYEVGGSDEITPPDLPIKKIKQIQQAAITIHKLLGCSGMSRVDMIIEKPKAITAFGGTPPSKKIKIGGGESQKPKIYVLEVNTIPGMTQTSLLPQQAQKMGLEFSQLLTIIARSGLNRKK